MMVRDSSTLALCFCVSSEQNWCLYIDLGCFVTKHGVPTRSCGYVRWESKADAFAFRGRFLLLFSADFVEVRDVNTARLVQVISGIDIRLLAPVKERSDDILVAMNGDKDDSRGASIQLLEMLETTEIQTPQRPTANAWDEWDMT
jgi:RHO1 GDP-GTP exchange protein 1/2